MKKLETIFSKGEHYNADIILDDSPVDPSHLNSVFFVGDFDNDWDGSKRWKEDPYGQSDTTLHYNGKPIDSWAVAGIVLPPECITVVSGVVLGCYAEVTYKGRTRPAVVFDVGPHFKLGEGTPCLAVRLGIDPGHSSGGVDEQAVTYRYWPGRAALVDGIQYQLQHYGK